MVYVTLGTQKESFARLLDCIEKSQTKQKIIVQAGHTKYVSAKMTILDFVTPEQNRDYLKRADIIITHGGTGSILTALKMGKKVIACARLKKYDEHVDDHQEELVKAFAKEGYIIEFNESDSLKTLLKTAGRFKPKKYISNTPNFIKHLIQEID